MPELNYNGDYPAAGTITYPEQETKTDLQKTQKDIIKEVKEFRENFNCQRCGKCCEEGIGVALWPHEYIRLQKIEKHLLRYITYINTWRVLKMPCVFYNKKKHKCRIYDKRPIACQMFPMGVKPDMSFKFSQNCPEINKGISL